MTKRNSDTPPSPPIRVNTMGSVHGGSTSRYYIDNLGAITRIDAGVRLNGDRCDDTIVISQLNVIKDVYNNNRELYVQKQYVIEKTS